MCLILLVQTSKLPSLSPLHQLFKSIRTVVLLPGLGLTGGVVGHARIIIGRYGSYTQVFLSSESEKRISNRMNHDRLDTVFLMDYGSPK